MDWNQIVERVTPHIVKIETPSGHGTGFLCLYNDDKSLVGIATAHHVVEHAERWQQPIRIEHDNSKNIAFLKESERFIISDPNNDSAVILFTSDKLVLPSEPIELLPIQDRLPIGSEVGWIGYPGIGPQILCFFSGNISARNESRHTYLIDGVAINGVSGGPVLHSTPTDGVKIVGTIAAYMVNRNTGEALPGLSVAQDVSHFHATVSRIRNLDEAKKKQSEAGQGSTPVQPAQASPAG